MPRERIIRSIGKAGDLVRRDAYADISKTIGVVKGFVNKVKGGKGSAERRLGR